jgi:hypothetical protein
MDKYVGKEIISFTEVQESDVGTKVLLCIDGKFESVACSDKAKAKVRGSEHPKNKKKCVYKKKSLSSHRKKAAGGWEE